MNVGILKKIGSRILNLQIIIMEFQCAEKRISQFIPEALVFMFIGDI
jgi:hypothetical protein